MNNKSLLGVLLVLALLSLSCRAVQAPFNRIDRIDRVEVGETVTDEIEVEAPDTDGEVEVELSFGAGSLNLNPGAGSTLISGTATYNVAELKPDVSTSGNRVKLSPRDTDFGLGGIRELSGDVRNEWDLELGDQMMDLTIEAGAYRGSFELGGLSITSLDVSDGAADVDLSFSEPNLVEMDRFRYRTGASSVDFFGLANANFAEMIFNGGAGDYRLDFSGELQRDADIDIEAGISQITIIIPEGTAAVVNLSSGFSNVDTVGDWTQSGDTYTLEGEGPVLTFDIDLAAGNLNLETR